MRINPLDIFTLDEFQEFLDDGELLFIENDVSSEIYIDNLKMMLQALEQREQYEWCPSVVIKINAFNNLYKNEKTKIQK
jgi:hypothetical protein